MEHVGHVWRVRAGMAEEYRRRHRKIWPELEALLRGAEVETYAIYQWGDVIFSHISVEDYDRLVAAYDGDPVAERWEASLADVLEYPNADPVTGWPERMTEVWSLGNGER